MGQSPSSKYYTDDSSYHILVQGNADIDNGRVVPRVWTKKATKFAGIDDILFSVRAPVGEIGKTKYNVAIGRGVASIKADEFIFQYLLKLNNKKFWKKLSTGSTFESINSDDLKNLQVLIPCESEKIKIGRILEILDNIITLYQRKIKVLNHLKYSYLSNMLSDNMSGPILRFSYYNSNWRNYLLGDIGRVYSGIGFPENEQGGKSGIPFYKISDMNTKGNETELFHSNNYVTKIQIERNKWKVFEKNIAIMFAKVGAAIMLNRKRIVKPPFLIDNNSMIYLLNDNWDYRFAKFLFDTLHLPKYAQVGALPSYNASEINGIKVCIPDVHEQKDIGNALFLLEKMSKYNSLRLLKILNLKKSYFNYLFI